MKKYLIISVILTGIFPALIVAVLCKPDINTSSSSSVSPKNEQITVCTEPITSDIPDITVSLIVDQSVEIMPLETYLIGVVLGEMPADFELEALKAQAIVARTFTCKRIQNSKHDSGDICSEYSCCQAYISESEYLAMGGTEAAVEKIRTAVNDTRGEVLRYEGDLIEATYFSCSGGKTEDAAAVWGASVPYLQSVESPGEEGAAHYTDTVKFSVIEFCSLLDISADSYLTVDRITYTEGGGVGTLNINGESFSGTELRQKLGLRSTAFVISVMGQSVTITTKGFGHRVGMSQYGADAMALRGYDCYGILNHYYSGTYVSTVSY